MSEASATGDTPHPDGRLDPAWQAEHERRLLNESGAVLASARLFGISDALDSDAWYTPPWIFDGLGVELDLDVAAPAEPLAWIPARHRYTVADDGLILPWFGLIWCNPPYSAPTAWCRRWSQHPDGFLLVRADLSTSGPFVAFSAASSVYVPPKRVQFVNGHGGSTGAVNFSSVLFGRGDTADAALARLAASKGGSSRRLGVPHNGGWVPCRACDGRGTDVLGDIPCSSCRGRGEVQTGGPT